MRWSLAMVAACYSPRITPGSPCDTTHPCPAELTCSPATHTCEHTATGAVDAAPMDGTTCYGSGLVRLCFAQPPGGDIQLTASLGGDTTTSPLCMQMTGACVVAASHVTIDAGVTATVTGANPLVILGAASIDISGTLDVASHRNGSRGPGANPADCPLAPASTNATGGPGGSFGGRGGKGGDALFSTGAASGPAIVPTMLRGGCQGSPGNPGGGEAGAGGGVVYLMSGGQISITGIVDASGAGGGGGGGGTSGRGGGGGGAGGMIGLDAPTVMIGSTAQLFANGGGGGEAGDFINIGNNGADPSAPGTPAAGGAGASVSGGDGGNGAAGATLTGGDGQSENQGGGGGGGAGVILVFPKQMVGGSISPPPS
jgi:hypothetical protein